MRETQAPSDESDSCAKHGLDCASLDREQLVLNVAHELKSPLTGLRLHVERMQRQLQRDPSAPHDPQFVRFVSQMDHGLLRMQRLIEDLLEVTRFDSNNLPLKLDKTSMASVVRAAIQELEPQLSRNEFELTSHLVGECEGVWDASRLQQVITNLVNNAMRYGASPIELDVRAQDSRVEVAVRDHGPGIPEAERDCIFQRFERGQAAEGTAGLGLGLAICQNIVEAHGGALRVTQPPQGPGAVFVFELPQETSPAGDGATH